MNVNNSLGGCLLPIPLLGALHHESSPRNKHAHLMSMSSCFLTFLHYVQKSSAWVGWLRRIGHAEGK